MDLSLLSIPELKTLQDNVAKTLEQRQAAGVAKARSEIERIAKEAGINLHELAGKTSKANKTGKGSAKVAVKYRHPSDPTLAWTGRGRQPQWAKALADAGQLESARV